MREIVSMRTPLYVGIVALLAALSLNAQEPLEWNPWNPDAGNEYNPVKGGSIRAIFSAEPDLLNKYIDNSAVTGYISDYIFDRLIVYDRELIEYTPGIAERWTEEDICYLKDGGKVIGMSEDRGETWALVKTDGSVEEFAKDAVERVDRKAAFTFYLVQNARFHDGKPLTSKDVKFTYDLVRNKHVDAASLRSYFEDLDVCEVIDDYTIRFELNKQYWDVKTAFHEMFIMPKHIFDPNDEMVTDPEGWGRKFNEHELHYKPIGSGRYKFKSWDRGVSVSFTRNDDWWGGTPGYLDQITIKFIPDRVAALQSLKNGEADFLPRMGSDQYMEQTDHPAFLANYCKGTYYYGNMSYIGWNTRKPPFDDVRVRQAMTMACFDRGQFLKEVLFGLGERVTGTQYIFGPAYDHDIEPLPYDPEWAEELLLEAGWFDRDGDGIRDKDGQAFEFTLLSYQVAATHPNRKMYAMMIENFQRLGIKMDVKEMEWATFLEFLYDRKFDACALGWATSPESDPYQLWHTSGAENRGSNHCGFGDAETDALIEESRRAVDPEKRRALLKELQRVIMDQQPYTMLFCIKDKGAYHRKYRGVKHYSLRPGYQLWEWYIPKELQ